MSTNPAARLQVELDFGERREIPLTRDPRSLADLHAAHGLPLNTRCVQRGLCRGCEVALREGSLLTDSGAVTAPATVQACRARLAGPALVHIPARSLIE